MNVETKFGIGDQVWHVRKHSPKTWIPCSFCGATGTIIGADESARGCPECYGKRGEYAWPPQAWLVKEERMTIGSVEIQVRGEGHVEERYMCLETGVGSGSVYYADDLFLVKRKALRVCAERNLRDGLANSPDVTPASATAPVGASEKDVRP